MSNLSEKDLEEILKRGHVKVNRDSAVPAANVEPDTGNAPLPQKKAPRFDSPVDLHIHSIRKRLIDPDGCCAKYAIDGLVHAGILRDDSTREVRQVSYSQTKAKKGEEERTIITIEEVE